MAHNGTAEELYAALHNSKNAIKFRSVTDVPQNVVEFSLNYITIRP